MNRAAFFAVSAIAFALLATLGLAYHQGWRLVRDPSVVLPAAGRSCAEVFVPGKTIVIGDGTCTGSHGETHPIPRHACTKARRLVTISATTGAPQGYGFDGGPYVAVAGVLAADAGFAEAMDSCLETPPPPPPIR